jgi:hypothetical protein
MRERSIACNDLEETLVEEINVSGKSGDAAARNPLQHRIFQQSVDILGGPLALANCRSLNGLDLAHGQVGHEQRPLAAMPIAEIEKPRSCTSFRPAERPRSKQAPGRCQILPIHSLCGSP